MKTYRLATLLPLVLIAFLSHAEEAPGSTIPRTQTINMLRELMFRTCERYLNGAYNGFEMSVQAVRDQRLMVSILAIEQITGAVIPKPIVISASGASSAKCGDEAIVRLDDAVANGTYLGFLGCPFFVTSALASMRDFISKG